METIELTPQQRIEREIVLITNLSRIRLRHNNTTFLQQIDKALMGCENRIRAIQLQNGMEVNL